MRLDTWKVRGLYRSGSLLTVARNFMRYKLDLVGVQKVMWDEVGMVRAGYYIYSMENETKIITREQDFFVHHRNQQLRQKIC